ncbi:MAG: hypothetical protein HGA54_04565 [Actinobacteria bacterium]|nr:hypothetical protein [Actinomycetota bacterium]
MSYFLRRIWNPAIYQGGNVNRRYFEGWYFKQADAEGRQVFAVIPGVSFSADGTSKHAFVQIISGGGSTHYFSYPIESFVFDPREPFNIQIGDNIFTEAGMTLRLKDSTAEAYGEVRFGAWTPWPVTTLSPGIMGWYRFVPFMETYHGVLSMDHEVSGSVVLDGETIRLDDGRGYIEKDWGHSFPSSWIWAQSNHFDRPGVSVSISVAKVPWLTGAFVGHIAGLQIDGKLHRFATYTGARLVCIETGTNEAHLILRDRREELDVGIHGSETLSLKAPTLGAMVGHDAESLGGTIDVTLRELRGGQSGVVFQGTGTLAGIEVMNDRNELGSVRCDGV